MKPRIKADSNDIGSEEADKSGRSLRYNHGEVEKKWQRVWSQFGLDSDDLEKVKKPFYNLMMFPYPSAEGLHVGNMYAFTGSDIYGRFKRMQGFDVFEPIGLDGFGIHSENYSLKVGRHPADHAAITEKNFYNQMRQIGAMFDWDRTIETYKPDYYKWTQWLFVQMFKHGLAYRGKSYVNWCPGCKTVLADEQVINGSCERCGKISEKRLLEQWFFKITAYAEKLQEKITALNWSQIVKTAQTKWIGKKEGIIINYDVCGSDDRQIGSLGCFTTRPDTNFGATFVVMAPDHPFVSRVLEVTENKKSQEIREYIKSSIGKTEQQKMEEGRVKTGIDTGLVCVNQLTGYMMPLYISDFVLMGFGTGAVVGVPGHDKRDFEFARAFNLPIMRVVVGADGDKTAITDINQVQEDEGIMINSGFLDGLDIHTATQKMMDYIENKGWGKRTCTYHLRDWLISRQRYWGPPIPMVFCETCAQKGESWFTTNQANMQNSNNQITNYKQNPESGIQNPESNIQNPESNQNQKINYQSDNQNIDAANNLEYVRQLADCDLEYNDSLRSMAGWYPVPESELPVVLPKIDDYKPGDDGIAPLAKHKEFYETKCPECGGPAVRETDVSDTFLDSSWYFLRYPSISNSKSQILNPKLMQNSKTQNSKSLENLNLKNSKIVSDLDISASGFNLPWDLQITSKWLPVDMYTGGAEHSVLHLLYSRFVTMALHDFGYLDFQEPFKKFFAHGLVIKDGTKMSKSRGNVVNPDEYIRLYGADALRMYLMFMGPFSEGGDFRDSAMEGMGRWIGRVWRMAVKSIQSSAISNQNGKQMQHLINKLIKKVGHDLEERKYNTAIAAMMEFTNSVGDAGGTLPVELLKKFILILAPLAPFMSEELWGMVNNLNHSQYCRENSVHFQPWPDYDTELIVDDKKVIAVQINGKTRDQIEIDTNFASDQKFVGDLAAKSPKVKAQMEGKSILKVIFVPGRIINFVVR